ncbi:MAG: hypothetical protein CMP57_00750 [Flavobacteriales bacterium]|nr:hypothetical protein [Flavobacteriales bacterium]|tara:strand:+ start:17022 stop:18530 length:1509 start_codon:yes stop_codon:yes gene_type:complete
MKIYNSIASKIIKKRINQINLFIEFPHKIQDNLLKKLIQKAKNTAYGIKYNFKYIQSKSDFVKNIPLSNYDDLDPYINRMRTGEQNVLWPSRIKWFAKSSGTENSKSKYIPISDESIKKCHYKGGKDLLSIYCNHFPVKNIFQGKSVLLGGSHEMSRFSNQIYEGDLSAIIVDNLPFWVRLQQSPSKEISLMSEWEKKIDLMVDQAIYEDVSSLSGVPSWAMIFANKVLEKTGKSNLHQVWPNFELYMHGGVQFSPYRKYFEKIFPKGINYLETYNASEGFFGVQDIPGDRGMLLMLNYGIYYEFLPLKGLSDINPISLSLEQVNMGEDYAMVISTNSGLWRYLIGDTIRFTCLSPFRIIVTGRTKHFLNSFGEELMVHNADQALQIACDQTKSEFIDYTASSKHASTKMKAHHEWLIEFIVPPKDLNFFVDVFDSSLMNLNSDYEAKRFKSLILQKPILHIAKKRLFYNWMKQKGKLGGQNKVPRLSDDRIYLEELLKMNS